MKYLIWALKIVAAGILLQTLFFKFSGAEESKFIFSALGAEPEGRIFSGVAELIVAILLLIPRTQFLGALGAIGVMAGAILSHIFVLGLVVQDDGGLLFALACTVLIACVLVLVLQKREAILQLRQLATRLMPGKN